MRALQRRGARWGRFSEKISKSGWDELYVQTSQSSRATNDVKRRAWLALVCGSVYFSIPQMQYRAFVKKNRSFEIAYHRLVKTYNFSTILKILASLWCFKIIMTESAFEVVLFEI